MRRPGAWPPRACWSSLLVWLAAAAGRRARPASSGRGSTRDMRRFFRTLGPGRDRLGRRADRHVRRHDHRLVPADRRGVVALLRRPALPAPVGVIGIAAGTVLLPEMSRRIAAGDVARAHAAQNRADRLHAGAGGAVCVAFLAMPGPHHVRPVPARRVRRGGRRSGPAPCWRPTRRPARRGADPLGAWRASMPARTRRRR